MSARIPEAPREMTPGAVLARLLDALAFRFHWATEGLRPEDIAFTAAEGGMSIRELAAHIHRMMAWLDGFVGGAPASPDPEEFEALRAATQERLASLRKRLAAMSPEQLGQVELRRRDGSVAPIWNAINGPLADALTHVGQINMARRVSGNPVASVNWFEGRER